MSVITRDPDVLGGQPVFRGTRVPVETLFVNLEAGLTLDEIVAEFPSLSKDDLVAALREAQERLESA